MSGRVKRKKGAGAGPDIFRRVTDWYLFAALGAFPLVAGVGDYGYETIIRTKAAAWFLLTGLWALALLGLAAAVRRKGGPVPARLGRAQWAALGFLAVNVLSAALSEHPAESFFQIDSSNNNSVIFIASYTAAFIGVSLFGKLRRGHVWALSGSMSLCCLVALLQLGGLNPFGLYPAEPGDCNEYAKYGHVFLGTIGNKDFLAAFLCFAAPLLAVYAARSRERSDRLLFLPAAFSAYILYASGVDMWKVGFAGCLVLVPPVVIRGRRASRRAAAVCAMAAIAGLVTVYFWPGTDGFLWEASRIMRGEPDPLFGSGRINTWMDGWRYASGHLLTGNGPGASVWLYQASRSINLATGFTGAASNTHNVYLGYLVEGGIFALLGYLVLIGMGCAGWIKGRGEDPIAALGAGVACYLVQDFFNLGMVTGAPLLWIGLGLLAQASGKGKEDRTKERSRLT